MNTINFATGVADILVLAILKNKDSYIYELISSIKEYSEERLIIPLSSIYHTAYRLESEGNISSYSKLVGKRRTRVYYHIEPQGEIYLKKLLKSYKETAEGIAKVLSSVEGSEWEWAI